VEERNWNLELGTWNLELGTWNLELGTGNWNGRKRWNRFRAGALKDASIFP
jgi:hypothetical protein